MILSRTVTKRDTFFTTRFYPTRIKIEVALPNVDLSPISEKVNEFLLDEILSEN